MRTERLVQLAAAFTLSASLGACAHPATAHKGWRTYSNAQAGFQISYPDDWSVDTKWDATDYGPGAAINGIEFGVPAGMTNGTNLSNSLTGLSVEWRQDGQPCDASRFLPNVKDVHTETSGGREWSTADTSEGAAGNIYEQTVFVTAGSKACIAVRYLIHSTQIGNYDPGTVKAFDHKTLLKSFDAIRATIKVE